MPSSSPHYYGRSKPHYDKPEDLAVKVAEFLEICLNGAILYGMNGDPILGADKLPVREHSEHTVPTMTSLAWHCGFMSRKSLYDYEKKGDEWADIIDAFREAAENWFVIRGVRPKSGDNPIYMSLILQSVYGYIPASKRVIEGTLDKPLAIAHQTPDDVARVIDSLNVPARKAKKDA